MKHLFFVAVAAGIFSGTNTTASAQSAVNNDKFNTTGTSKKSPQFIEGIEIKRDAASSNTVDMWAVPVKKTTQPAAPATRITAEKSAISIENSSLVQFKYAQLLDMEVEAVTNINLFNVIDEWWATRYRYGGSTKKGIDCSAFTGTLYTQAFHISLTRTAREQYDQCEKIYNRTELQEGDLVFFNTRGGISHVGLYLGNSYFVHSSVHDGVTISSLNDDYYNRKFVSGGRLPKCDE
jgi:lipoprotein Spr